MAVWATARSNTADDTNGGLNMCVEIPKSKPLAQTCRGESEQNNGCRSFCFRAMGEQCEHNASTFQRIINYLHLYVLFN